VRAEDDAVLRATAADRERREEVRVGRRHAA
jgi:hypothetical protein